jgi:hypothetical protein
MGRDGFPSASKDDTFYFSARYAYVRPEDAKRLFMHGAARQIDKAAVTCASFVLLLRKKNSLTLVPVGH